MSKSAKQQICEDHSLWLRRLLMHAPQQNHQLGPGYLSSVIRNTRQSKAGIDLCIIQVKLYEDNFLKLSDKLVPGVNNQT